MDKQNVDLMQQGAYLICILVAIFFVARGHWRRKINLWELVTAKDREGTLRTDARKFYEAGAFVILTITLVFVVVQDELTEWYALIYVGAFVAARSLRDREQRLSRAIELDAAAGHRVAAPGLPPAPAGS